MKRKALMGLLAGLVLSGTVITGCSGTAKPTAQKEEPKWPTKQIEVTVPFAAGGGTDLTARAMAEYLSKEWGQPIVVVNKTGAGGATGTQAVVKQGSKDGYSVLVQSVSAVSALYAGNTNLPYKMEDLVYVAKLVDDPLAYVVKADAPWKDLKEFNEWVKKNTDQLTFASNGTTAIGTFGVIQWMDSIGADFSKAKLVATNGSGDALPKVAGGHIILAAQGVSEVSNLVKAGKLKILGIASPKRSPYFPDVPTMEEQGVKGITVALWYGLSLQAGTPDYIVKKWESSIEKMMKDPVFLEKIKTLNGEPGFKNSADFTKHVKDETARMTEILKQKGLAK
ncbi:tripartite tricarboxylate transporter substrate binding protein [Effusibacillus lacus]|uniref:Transporter n=1 Tax=Effusibacillus lacus TaxID=1348429 RepID=A0A292YJK7_9BACL|nr:tripartite tricarboxylate transporter substrate binding protein [Effusibacillus lacus]TCS71613.1 tripartite-type tricarboxylate transporter receptor subunit TctC [Effusibacillus lacus]GAX90118.1 transporter [Effusibacillus lacus]